MSRSRRWLTETCTWSAGRHVAQLVAPGRRLRERARLAIALPTRVRADVVQARRMAVYAERGNGGKRIWIVSDKRPDPSADSASLRLAWIVLIALRRGYDVSLYLVTEGAWLSPAFGNDAPASLALESSLGPADSPSIAWIMQPDAACITLPMLASTSGARI